MLRHSIKRFFYGYLLKAFCLGPAIFRGLNCIFTLKLYDDRIKIVLTLRGVQNDSKQ